MVCNGDYEPRQPQDFVRGVADVQTPAWSRPEAQDSFITVSDPLFDGCGIVGLGVVGISIVGKAAPSWYFPTPPSTFTEP